jgi:hypothetical protein
MTPAVERYRPGVIIIQVWLLRCLEVGLHSVTRHRRSSEPNHRERAEPLMSAVTLVDLAVQQERQGSTLDGKKETFFTPEGWTESVL